MKRNAPVFILMFGLISFLPAFSQQTTVWPWPWTSMQEYDFPFLPVGGWNTPAAFSPRSLAMGETYLSSGNSTAGFLNPAYLSALTAPQFSLSYRFTENRYKTSSWPYMDLLPQGSYSETRSFSRGTDYLDSAGLALPFEKWVVAANYFLFQEYNIPDIKGPFWGYPIPLAEPDIWIEYPQSIAQSGFMKGLNLAFSYRLTESFALGASVSYVFGDIERVQEWPEIYYIQPDKNGDSTSPPYGQIPSTTQKYSYDAKGFFFNFGFTWEPSRQVTLGFSLRPPFSLDVQTELEYTDSAGSGSYLSQDNYFKHPLVAAGSLLFHPLESLCLTLDLSYWGWGEFSTDIDPGWFGSYDFQSVVKLNLGAEYEIGLPFDVFEALALRAGYIYDPQPYRYSPNIARDYVTFGFGLPVGDLDFHFAAKLGLSGREQNRFHSDVLQIGGGYRF
jgi:Outer membrane protein transport protein (OMPP1/FadL/TodX)